MAKSPITGTKPEPQEDSAEQEDKTQASNVLQENPEDKAARIQSRAEALAMDFYRIKGSLCDYASLSHNEKGFWHGVAAKMEK